MNDDVAIDVILEGGPADLPVERRNARVAAGEHRVKVAHSGGYEHFERPTDASPGRATGNQAAGSPVVFRWTMRTRIAE